MNTRAHMKRRVISASRRPKQRVSVSDSWTPAQDAQLESGKALPRLCANKKKQKRTKQTTKRERERAEAYKRNKNMWRKGASLFLCCSM